MIGMETILFITANEHKLEEANRILSPFDIELKISPQKKVEIQSRSLMNIARHAALVAAKSLQSPVLVEDSGLFINALKGFPGPFSSYVHSTIGCEGIIRLLTGVTDRRALFKCAIAFCAPTSRPETFQGVSLGHVSPTMRGTAGFGFDPIFIPDGGGGLTFAEMPPEEKDRLSHRGAAFRTFGRWYSAKNMAKP